MIIQLLAALVGSLGFAALFNLHGKADRVCTRRTGAWTVYLALNSVLTNANLSALITCALITLHSEFLARKMRAPAIIFMVVATIPLIPGAGLYRTAGALSDHGQLAGRRRKRIADAAVRRQHVRRHRAGFASVQDFRKAPLIGGLCYFFFRLLTS